MLNVKKITVSILILRRRGEARGAPSQRGRLEIFVNISWRDGATARTRKPEGEIISDVRKIERGREKKILVSTTHSSRCNYSCAYATAM